MHPRWIGIHQDRWCYKGIYLICRTTSLGRLLKVVDQVTLKWWIHRQPLSSNLKTIDPSNTRRQKSLLEGSIPEEIQMDSWEEQALLISPGPADVKIIEKKTVQWFKCRSWRELVTITKVQDWYCWLTRISQVGTSHIFFPKIRFICDLRVCEDYHYSHQVRRRCMATYLHHRMRVLEQGSGHFKLGHTVHEKTRDMSPWEE